MGQVKEKRKLTELKDAYDAHNHTSIHGTDATSNNSAGGACTVQGGKGKGNGAGGSFKVQTAPAGSSGSTPGTLTDRLEIDSNGVLWIPTVTTEPTVGQAGRFGIYRTSGGALKMILPDNSTVTVTVS